MSQFIVKLGSRSNLKENNSQLSRDVDLVNFNLTKIHGQNLLPMDRNGTSDPYVKIFHNEKLLFKTQVIKNTLNPHWFENVSLCLDKTTDKICFQVVKEHKNKDSLFFYSFSDL